MAEAVAPLASFRDEDLIAELEGRVDEASARVAQLSSTNQKFSLELENRESTMNKLFGGGAKVGVMNPLKARGGKKGAAKRASVPHHVKPLGVGNTGGRRGSMK